MAELSSAMQDRPVRTRCLNVRNVQIDKGVPDYAGDHMSIDAVAANEERFKDFVAGPAGDDAIPTDYVDEITPGTVPDIGDTFNWHGGIRMYMDYDGGVGELADITIWVRCDNGHWVYIGTLGNAAHREELASEEINGRPVFFQLENATDAGTLHFTPIR